MTLHMNWHPLTLPLLAQMTSRWEQHAVSVLVLFVNHHRGVKEIAKRLEVKREDTDPF